MLAIFAVGSSANIVLLSISFVVSRFAIRVRNGVENFLAYRSQYENMCTYSIFYFGLKKGSLWFHVSLTMAFHFFSSFFLSSAYCRWWYTLFGDARFMTVIMKFVEYINLYTCTLDNAIYCFIFISVACLHSSTLKLQPNADLIEQLKWKESPK